MLNVKIESDKRSRVIVGADVRIIKIRMRLEVSKTVVLLTILKSQCQKFQIDPQDCLIPVHSLFCLGCCAHSLICGNPDAFTGSLRPITLQGEQQHVSLCLIGIDFG